MINKFVAVATFLLITGCATLTGPRTGTISPPTDALARWKDFPADQTPRPIVLIRSFLPSAGCKLAPTFQPSTEVPKEATASWTDGTSYTYAAISEADAINAGTGHPCSKRPPVAVTAGRLGTVRFRTDRGGSSMTTWLFTTGDGLAEIPYPAIVPSAFWSGGSSPASIGGAATVSANGRELTFTFPGGPPDGPCAEDYTGVIAESHSAVAIAVQSNPGRTVGGPVTCDLVGHIRSVTVQLANPLSGRVVVDASGGVVAVCPEAIRPVC